MDFEKAESASESDNGADYVVRKDGSFRFYAPFEIFEKADAPEGQRRRIAGVVSTDCRDKQRERLLQEGLDFTPFLKEGFINDNHAKGIQGIIGEPDPSSFFRFKKGDRLPNGDIAKSNGHWSEAWLYEGDPRADEVWKKAMAMKKSGARRRLGFSIEGGAIKTRETPNGKDIVKGVVRHVAVTHCPVNPETSLETFAKSLEDFLVDDGKRQVEEMLGAAAVDAAMSTIDGTTDLDLGNRDVVTATLNRVGPTEKAMSMGPGSSARPSGARTGEGAGAILARQSVEGVVEKSTSTGRLTIDQAFARVRERFPNIKCAAAGRVVDLALARSRGGKNG